MAARAQKPTVLIVDDEATIREVIRRYLEREGFDVREAGDGYAALDALDADSPDLMVLDLMLPGLDGMAVARRVREHSRIPIIMLTAKGEQPDRIYGFEQGADDYVVKPFSPRELILRIKAVLRRTEEAAPDEGEILEFQDLVLNPVTRTVSVRGEEISLTTKEFDLLAFMMRHPKRVFNRDQLMDNVWGYEYYGDASTVTVHIRRLREKIERDPSNPQHLLTVWGVGYKFEG
jgi:DNA-binding response OmpR family regulator